MKLIKYLQVLSLISLLCFSNVVVGQKDIDRALKTWNKESIPYIYPENLTISDSILFLDTREKEDEKKILETIPNTSQPIIVYCSIGVRSENIGEKLKKLGYTKIRNLHGGIFGWKNKGGEVFNDKEKATDSVHAFSKHWGKLLHEGIKVY